MIREVKIYEAVCDGCDGILIDLDNLELNYDSISDLQRHIDEETDCLLLKDGRVLCLDCRKIWVQKHKSECNQCPSGDKCTYDPEVRKIECSKIPTITIK